MGRFIEDYWMYEGGRVALNSPIHGGFTKDRGAQILISEHYIKCYNLLLQLQRLDYYILTY